MLHKAINLDDNYLLDAPTTNTTRRVYTCCLLLIILLTKRTLRHFTISLDTAKRYVGAHASLCALVQAIDVRKDLQTDGNAGIPYLLLCANQKRWEEDPKRKEPWSIDMQRNLEQWCLDTAQPEDSLASAMSDWFCVGCYNGHRKSKWAQDKQANCIPSDFARKDGDTNMPRAFTLSDIAFYTSRRKPLTTNQVLAMSETTALRMIGQMSICWRTQRNGKRNQLIYFTPNTKSPSLCCIRRMLRILRHFKGLSGGDNNLPLSLYQSDDKQTFNITAKESNKLCAPQLPVPQTNHTPKSYRCGRCTHYESAPPTSCTPTASPTTKS